MTTNLRVFLLLFSAVFLYIIFRSVARGRLQLKYALMWIVVGIVLIVSALFPGIVSLFSELLGFHVASNMVFMIAIVLILAVCLSLTMIVSWQSRDIRVLIERVSLLEKKLGEETREIDSKPPDEPSSDDAGNDNGREND
jgi:hypothetical protein